jgi:hypothetical protein
MEFKTIYIGDDLIELNTSNYINHTHVYEIGEVIMSNSVISIKDIDFAFCGNLKKVTLSENLENIPRHFFRGCYNLTEINIPKNCYSISESAFYSCLKLKKINLSSSLLRLEESVFNFCPIEEIEIPELLRYIYPHSFANMPTLKKIKVSPNWTPIFISDKIFGISEKPSQSPFSNILEKLKMVKFIDFLKDINEDDNNVFKYLEKDLLNINDVRFLLRDEYIGLKEGTFYGI